MRMIKCVGTTAVVSFAVAKWGGMGGISGGDRELGHQAPFGMDLEDAASVQLEVAEVELTVSTERRRMSEDPPGAVRIENDILVLPNSNDVTKIWFYRDRVNGFRDAISLRVPLEDGKVHEKWYVHFRSGTTPGEYELEAARNEEGDVIKVRAVLTSNGKPASADIQRNLVVVRRTPAAAKESFDHPEDTKYWKEGGFRPWATFDPEAAGSGEEDDSCTIM